MIVLNQAGTTIFLTTQYTEEPQQLCGRIAIVDGGELKTLGTSSELKAMIPSNNTVSIKLADLRDDFIRQAWELPKVKNAVIQNGLLNYTWNPSQTDFNQILGWTQTLGAELQNISLSTSTLDDVFIHLTGKGIRNNGWNRKNKCPDHKEGLSGHGQACLTIQLRDQWEFVFRVAMLPFILVLS